MNGVLRARLFGFGSLLLLVAGCAHKSSISKKTLTKCSSTYSCISQAYEEEYRLIEWAEKNKASEEATFKDLKKIILIKLRDQKRGGLSWFFDTIDMTYYPLVSYEAALKKSIEALQSCIGKRGKYCIGDLEYVENFNQLCDRMEDLVYKLNKARNVLISTDDYLRERQCMNTEIQSRRINNSIGSVSNQLFFNRHNK